MKRGEKRQYQNIDPVLTGRNLQLLMQAAQLNVHEICRALYLSSRNSVYRWYSGETLPALDHLVQLSRWTRCRMEDMLVLVGEDVKIRKYTWEQGEMYLGYVCPANLSMRALVQYLLSLTRVQGSRK